LRHGHRSGRQRSADLKGLAILARVGQLIQAHGSADTTAGSIESWLAGLARDTGILSRRFRTTRRNIVLNPRCLKTT